MLWQALTQHSQLQDIILTSQQPGSNRAVVIFKHSTRCSISSMVLNRFESRWQDDPSVPAYFLDLIQYRDLSNEIASVFDVVHQSPQVLVIKNGSCIYNASHTGISVPDILEAIAR